MPKVLVIIPAYNEADSIASVIEAIGAHTPDYHILVIDDGSTDNTAAIAGGFANTEVVSMPYNVGIGAAMQTGYQYALQNDYDVAVQCDADGQHPPGEIPHLIERIEDGTADLIVGSRYVAHTGYEPSFSRRVGKSLLSRLVDFMIGGGITDTTSGFRACNRRVIRLFARRYPDDYPEAEALIIVHRAGLKAAEIPVVMRPRQGGRTSIRPQHAVYYMVKVALAIFVNMFRKP